VDFPATLLGTKISPKKTLLKMIVLFLRWDMLVPWRVGILDFVSFGDFFISAPCFYLNFVARRNLGDLS